MMATMPKPPAARAIEARSPERGRGYVQAAATSKARHQAADEMIAGRRARLRLQEAVVDDVQRDDKHGANAEHHLPTRHYGGG